MQVCLVLIIRCIFFFFFQAEDGIRDIGVTGVQTWRLPLILRDGSRLLWCFLSRTTVDMKANKSDFAPPIHILIVDDHALIRDGMKQVLTDALKRVAFGDAENGDQALEAVSRQRWDLVLLDMTLPDKSGLEILDQV